MAHHDAPNQTTTTTQEDLVAVLPLPLQESAAVVEEQNPPAHPAEENHLSKPNNETIPAHHQQTTKPSQSQHNNQNKALQHLKQQALNNHQFYSSSPSPPKQKEQPLTQSAIPIAIAAPSEEQPPVPVPATAKLQPANTQPETKAHKKEETKNGVVVVVGLINETEVAATPVDGAKTVEAIQETIVAVAAKEEPYIGTRTDDSVVGVIKRTEARSGCETKSRTYKGPCASDTNCAAVCRSEGYRGGNCHGLRRRCLCSSC